MEKNEMNIEQQGAKLKSGVDDLQSLREKQYRQAIHLQEAQTANRKRELERLAKKYGKSDERVQGAKLRIKQSAKYSDSLSVQERRTSQAMQSVPKGGFALQGMVISESRKPQTNLNLGLTDKEGQWIRTIGAACTDENGFYRFTVDAKLVEAYQDQKFILNVFNDKKEVIYRDRTPLALSANKTEVRNLILPDKICQLPNDNVLVKPTELEVKPKTGEDPGFKLSGTVTDANGGRVAGIMVKAKIFSGKSSVSIGATTKTDKAGQYLITYTSAEYADLQISRTMVIQVSCYDAKGNLVGQKDAAQDLDRDTTIDVTLRG